MRICSMKGFCSNYGMGWGWDIPLGGGLIYTGFCILGGQQNSEGQMLCVFLGVD